MNLVQQVLAQSSSVGTQVIIPNTGITSLRDLFSIIINVLLGVGISLVVIFLILGGIQYITSKGDVKAADQARQSLTNAVIGFIVVVCAFTIKAIVQNVFGIGNDQLNVNSITPF